MNTPVAYLRAVQRLECETVASDDNELYDLNQTPFHLMTEIQSKEFKRAGRRRDMRDVFLYVGECRRVGRR